MIDKKEIIASARRYLDVPFRHQGRSRKGLDCLGLLVMVARDCELMRDGQLLAAMDDIHYGHIPSSERLQAGLARALTLKTDNAEPEIGDVLLFKIDGNAQHLGVVGQTAGEKQSLTLIHAYAPAKKVVEHRLDAEWLNKIHKKYRLI